MASNRIRCPILRQRIEKRLCRFEIDCVKAFGKAIVDGLKNLSGTGSIFLPYQQVRSTKSGT